MRARKREKTEEAWLVPLLRSQKLYPRLRPLTGPARLLFRREISLLGPHLVPPVRAIKIDRSE